MMEGAGSYIEGGSGEAKKERVRLCSAVFVALCVGHLNLKSCMYGVGLADGRVNISLPPFRDVHVLSHAKT